MIAAPQTVEETSRSPFRNSKIFLGVLKKSIRPGISAAILVEEGAYCAEQRYHWPGVAVAGALLGEGLWQWQLEQERKEREEGPQR